MAGAVDVRRLALGAVAVALLLEHVDPVPRQAEAEIDVVPEVAPA